MSNGRGCNRIEVNKFREASKVGRHFGAKERFRIIGCIPAAGDFEGDFEGGFEGDFEGGFDDKENEGFGGARLSWSNSGGDFGSLRMSPL